MAKLVVVVVVLVAILLVVMAVRGGCGGCPAPEPSSPPGVVRAAIEAIESRNPDKVAHYFWGPAQLQMVLRMRRLYEGFDTVDVRNVAVALRYEEDIVARVDASYDLVVASGGRENTQHIDMAVKLTKIDGRWLIKEAF